MPAAIDASQLRQLRYDAGLTYVDLAQRTELPTRLIAEVECGARPLNPDVAERIQRA